MKTKVSNLDKNRTSVIKRGVTVSDCYGFRFRVERVRMGSCVVVPLDAFGRPYDGRGVSACNQLSVVRA